MSVKRDFFLIFILGGWLAFSAACGSSPAGDYPIGPVPFTDVKVSDIFWLPRMETNRDVTIPFALKKCEETGRINNFAKAGGLMEGVFEGRRYNDSDVFKVMEGAAYSLSLRDDPGLDKYMDDLIAKVAAAQEDDGYLFTTRTIDPENPAPGSGESRWANLGSSHELYNVGHMYEAAVAHHMATGKRNFLDVAIKSADLIDRTFGPEKRRGFPGHQEIEIGLAKLYRITGKQKYLRLAKYFLDERGRLENYMQKFEKSSDFSIYNQDWYLQAHQPVLEQREAVGHAVRATYMYSGMADVAALTGDPGYIEAIDRIWENVVSRKLYLTGGIGSRHEGEAFGDDYELPNASAYNETCAAIGNIFWNHRLFLLHGDGKYIDVLERTLYNGFLAGISLSGDRFFYPNPLSSDGKYPFNSGECSRKAWFDCACCPVNIARFLASFPGYVYGKRGDTLYVNLFVQSEAEIRIADQNVTVNQETNYPWEGKINILITPERAAEFTLMVRVPGWAGIQPVPGDLYAYVNPATEEVKLLVNGKVSQSSLESGYFMVSRRWKRGDRVQLILPMPVQRVAAHEMVTENTGRVALERGPLVYCFEGLDNGGSVMNKPIDDGLVFSSEFRPNLLGGVVVLTGQREEGGEVMTAVPYYTWSHRGIGEMAVWMKRKGENE